MLLDVTEALELALLDVFQYSLSSRML